MTQPDRSSDAEADFGAAVRERRTLLQLTQDQVRRRLLDSYGIDLSKTAMSRLEQGERPIRLNEVTALAQLLDIDLGVYGRNSAIHASNGRNSARSEAEEIDAALAESEERLRAVEAELAVASNQAAVARATMQEAETRLADLQTQYGRLGNIRNRLIRSRRDVADMMGHLDELRRGHGEH